MTKTSKIVMGHNQWGKAEVRLVRITRDSARHEIHDLNITSRLHGELDAAHVNGDNSKHDTDGYPEEYNLCLREGRHRSPEEFLLRLGRHFVSKEPIMAGVGKPSSTRGRGSMSTERTRSFLRSLGTETRTAAVTISDEARHS